MPDHSEIRVLLEEKLSQLVAHAERIDDDLRESPDDDWEERATELEDDEVLSSLGNAALQEIEQIKHALHQIDTGAYGICTRCGAEIPQQRLEALPYATTCTKCA